MTRRRLTSPIASAAVCLAKSLRIPAIRQLYESTAAPERAVLGFSAAVVAFVAAMFVADLHSQYQTAIDEAKRSSLSFANIVAEHTARTFEAVDHILQEAALIHADFNEGKFADRKSLKDTLQHVQRTSGLVIALGWTDADGNLTAHSYESDPPRPNISDLPHFSAQRDANSDDLFISPPFKSVASGRWIS